MNVCSAWATPASLELPEGLKVSPQEKADALLGATGILFRLTGSVWPGECQDTVRPNRTGCTCDPSRTRKGCHYLSELELPGFPVLAVSNVTLDGDVVSEERYRVDDGRWLVYLPESDNASRRGWPCCQRLDRTTGEDDTWEVAYTWGGLPDVQGLAACRSLAKELLLAQHPGCGTACRLPVRVQSVTRQGISYVLLDDLSMFDQGRTGLPEVDLWLGSIRVGKSRRPAAIVDPHELAMRGRKVRRTDWNPSS